MGTRVVGSRNRYCPYNHPHAYGDKRKTLAQQYEAQGSSPRVWGQDNFALKDDQYLRIIPTRMGTSNVPPFICFGSKDHPHAYGDKNRATDALICGQGSSPRVWGQAVLQKVCSFSCGIIPTRMGTRADKIILYNL